MLERAAFLIARLMVKLTGLQLTGEALAYEAAGEDGRVMVFVASEEEEEEDDDDSDDDGGEPVALDPIWDIWGSES